MRPDGRLSFPAVFVSLTTVRDGDADVGQTARLAAESMVTWLQQFDGYQGLLVLADQSRARPES